ncbi:MAG TPA: glycosyl hydrolase family 18 protein [Candidatus Saccharimonadales bacterium]|nr:glycosyl hydrolase family 18 protein [Candidatus Saccharimonadales bacterium]
MKQLFIIIASLTILLTGGWFYFAWTYPQTPPATSATYFLENVAHPHAKLNKYVMGFLPYWNLDEIQYLRPDDLSEINYFSLNVNSDGHLATVANGQADPGWNGWTQQSTKNLITKAHIMGTRATITIAALDNDTITSVLNDNTAQENLISDTLKQVKTRNLDGITIDFEYTGTPDTTYRQEFTYFSKKLASSLKAQNTKATLTLSIMPVDGEQPSLYDFSKLTSVYDHFIGMSYDYYGQNSSIAGPIAPMNGFKEGKYFFDVTTTYTDFLKVIPKNKLLMGVPYYGWEWAVVNGSTINSTTYSSANPNSYAAIVSYARFRSDPDIKQNQCQWDKYSQESWCWFTDKSTGIDHQLWPMDDRGVQTRFDYANSQGLEGVAIWTLGSDKNYPDLWNEIQKTF